MSEVDLALIRRMLLDLWQQMDRSEFQFHEPPPGAISYWTSAYNRYLARLRPRFAEDPVFSQFEELPEGTPFGTVQMTVGHLHTYVEYHLGKDEPRSQGPGTPLGAFRELADLGRRMAEIGRVVRAIPGERAKAEVEELAELEAHLEGLEQRLAEKLGEEHSES